MIFLVAWNKMQELLEKNKIMEVELHKHLSKNYSELREKNKTSSYYYDCWAKETLSVMDKMPTKILDFGCGTGRLYPHIKDKLGSSYVGIDISKDMLNVAMKNYKGIRVMQSDGENMKFKDGSFDAVVVFGSLHHLPNPKKGLSEIKRVLSRNGLLVMSEPTSNFLIGYVRKLFYRSKKHFGPSHKSFLHREIVHLVRSEGFKIKKVKYFGLLAFPFGLPDIMPMAKYIPLCILKSLVYIDSVILKLPIISSFRFVTVILAEKP